MVKIKEISEKQIEAIAKGLEIALTPDKNEKRGNKNKEWRDSFLEYCVKHPEQRFFQALRNWAQKEIDPKINFVYFAPLDDQLDFFDTFYMSPEDTDKPFTK